MDVLREGRGDDISGSWLPTKRKMISNFSLGKTRDDPQLILTLRRGHQLYLVDERTLCCANGKTDGVNVKGL